MAKKLTILFAPINLVGPINAGIGIGEVLRDSGHRVVFAVKSDFRVKLEKIGFEAEIYGNAVEIENVNEVPKVSEDIELMLGQKTRIEKLKIMNKYTLQPMINELKEDYSGLEQIIIRVNPDVILADQYYYIPAIIDSGKPWVWIMSSNPLTFDWAMDEEKLPPSQLGLPTNGDPIEWNKLKAEIGEWGAEAWNDLNKWIISKGSQSLPKYKLLVPSPYLNFYIYPEELDYTDLRQLPKNFYRFDCFKRTGNEDKFEIPDKLRNKSGKLIYLSMGSIGSSEVELMKRLVSILSKSKHRFIVSKGVSADQYELGDNMWGEGYVPQIKVLPIVDLVIFHGGNNTFTETMYFGKPLIVMPLFFDQFDNAQRIAEKGFGLQFDPYLCTETELLDAIDTLLEDKALNDKITKVSKRIQNELNIQKIPKLLENLVK